MRPGPRAACLALGLAAAALPLARPLPAGLREFARLPVLEGGRVKPLDSFARNSLLLLRGKQTARVDEARVSAVEWLADVLWRPAAADTYLLFNIDDPELLGLLDLERGASRFYPYWQIDHKRSEIEAQASAADKIEPARRTRFQSAVLNLHQRLTLYERAKNTLAPSSGGEPVEDLDALRASLSDAVRAMSAPRPSQRQRRALQTVSRILERYSFLASAAAFKPLAPSAAQPDDAWLSVGEAVTRPSASRRLDSALGSLAALGRAWRASDRAAFAAAVQEYAREVERERPAAARAARAEELFNRAQPFISGMALYLAGLLLVFASWATKSQGVSRAAQGLLAAALLVHTAGLLARVLLQGRPPVTNLYSSAVFVGWTAAVLGLAAERVHRRGLAAAAAAATGFLSLLVAHHLSSSGDTLEMMRAVLDSNFWLATHVVTITIGYAGTFVAGTLGLAWIARRNMVRRPQAETSRALYALTYAALAFSLLFSFVGTVLGGIWADQSWGRFWGWDPKENGALLIVLWNALILHARWGGRIGERGVMLLAVLGNCVTAWSWFGVNMLGVGLHSYGFMDKAFWWLLAFVCVNVLAAASGLLPPRFWEERPAAS